MLWKTLVSDFDFAVWGAIAKYHPASLCFIVTRISGKYSFNEKINEGVVSVWYFNGIFINLYWSFKCWFYELLKLINLSIILN